MRAVVHIGPTKTGSTALASYFGLAQKRGKLPSNVIFPEGDLWFGQKKHSSGHLHQTITEMDAPNFGEFVPEVDRALQKIVDHAQATAGADATVVFISETTVVIRNPAALTKRLKKYFSDVTYVMVARLQDDAIASQLTQDLKKSIDSPRSDLELTEFMGVRDFTLRFDYAYQITHWKPVGDEHTLVVLPYLSSSSNPYLITSLFGTVLGDDIKLPKVARFEKANANRSPTKDQLLEIVALKKRYAAATAADDKPLMAELKAEFNTVKIAAQLPREQPQTETEGTEDTSWRINPRDAFFIRSLFEGSNRTLLSFVQGSPLAPQWRRWQREFERRLAESRALMQGSSNEAPDVASA